MHRKKLLDLLTAYAPSDPEEIGYQQEMLRFLKTESNCFERSLESGHFTGSAWLLNPDCSKALLLLHAKINLWVQPGGHCDGNSDVLEVALKEAREESGIAEIAPLSEEIFDLDIHRFPATNHQKEHLHYDVRFLLQITSDAEPILNHESKELKWVSWNEELPTKARSIQRMFLKWNLLRSSSLLAPFSNCRI